MFRKETLVQNPCLENRQTNWESNFILLKEFAKFGTQKAKQQNLSIA